MTVESIFQKAIRTVHTDLPSSAARSSERDRAPRSQARQHPNHNNRRQTNPKGNRLRRGQGGLGEADRRDDVDWLWGSGRYVGIHVPRAGWFLRGGRRHASRHLFTRRNSLRIIGLQDNWIRPYRCLKSH